MFSGLKDNLSGWKSEVSSLNKSAARQTCKLVIACFIKSLINSRMKMYNMAITVDAHGRVYTRKTRERHTIKFFRYNRIPRRHADMNVTSPCLEMRIAISVHSKAFDAHATYRRISVYGVAVVGQMR